MLLGRSRGMGNEQVKFALIDDVPQRTLYEILKLRSDVFVVEQNCPFSDMDRRDQNPTHSRCGSNETAKFSLLFAFSIPAMGVSKWDEFALHQVDELQEMHRTLAASQARELGLLDPEGEGSVTHPSLDRLIYADGKVVAPHI